MKKFLILSTIIFLILVNIVYAQTTTKINVFGTEYQVNDNATVFIKLYQNETPINNASCLLDIYYPDKTFFKYDTPMYYLEGSDGIYYYDFIAPNKTGIYIISVYCNWITQVGEEENANSYSIINGSLFGGSLTNTYISDNLKQTFVEVNDRLLVYYNFTNFTISETIFELDIHLEYQLEYRGSPSIENLYLEIYNYSSSSWYRIPQPIIGATSDSMWDYAIINNFNGNILDFVNNDTIMIRFIDNTIDGNDDILRIDHLSIIEKFKIGDIISSVSSCGELHITNYVYEIKSKMDLVAEDVWEMFLARGTPPLAPSTEYYCKDNNTLVKNITYEFCEGTKCKVYQKLEEIPCRFGCVENLTEHGAGCLPTKRSRTMQFMILLGVTTVVIGIIYYIFRTPS